MEHEALDQGLHGGRSLAFGRGDGDRTHDACAVALHPRNQLGVQDVTDLERPIVELGVQEAGRTGAEADPSHVAAVGAELQVARRGQCPGLAHGHTGTDAGAEPLHGAIRDVRRPAKEADLRLVLDRAQAVADSRPVDELRLRQLGTQARVGVHGERVRRAVDDHAARSESPTANGGSHRRERIVPIREALDVREPALTAHLGHVEFSQHHPRRCVTSHQHRPVHRLRHGVAGDPGHQLTVIGEEEIGLVLVQQRPQALDPRCEGFGNRHVRLPVVSTEGSARTTPSGARAGRRCRR